MSRWFFYGTLRHLPLLSVVLGRAVETRTAWLRGWRVVHAEGQAFPILMPDHHGEAEGLLVEHLTASDEQRLAWYEESFGYDRHTLTVEDAPANLYLPRHWQPGAIWHLDAWVRAHGALATVAADDYMAALGTHSAELTTRSYKMMEQRAASRLRAKAEGETMVERVKTGAGRVETESRSMPWLGYFGVREDDLRFQRFDGTLSPKVHRAGFLMGDAVTVLPYDPKRDRVLVIEQFRFGPHLRGDPNPWTLEPIAGRIDPGESPDDAARREAIEEARLALTDLILVARYYPSPGAVSEYLYSYIALTDLPDDAARVGGLETEDEDIKTHILSFDALMALVASPEAGTGPLILTAHALAGMRAKLHAPPRSAP